MDSKRVEHMPGYVIRNCFTHLFKQGSGAQDVSSVSSGDTHDNMQRDAVENNALPTRMGLHYLLSTADENDVHEEVTIAKFGRDVAVDTSSRLSGNIIYEDGAVAVDDDIEPAKKQLKILAVAKAAFNRHEMLPVEFRKYISDFQHEIWL